MKKRILIILSLSLLIGILGFGYFAKDQIRILWIQKQASANFHDNLEDFDSFQVSEMTNCFYYITLEKNDSINISISNIDIRNISLFNEIQVWDRYENAFRANLNTSEIESFDTTNGKINLKSKNSIEELTDWELYFIGSKTDIKLIAALEKLNINLKKFHSQVDVLNKINCNSLLTHENGIELTYDKGFVFQAGCITRKYYPVKYNIGKGDFLSAVRRLEDLNDKTQCYIEY